MAQIEWIFPSSVDEALYALSQSGHQAVAGGTTLFDLMKLGHAVGPVLVDVSKLPLTSISQHDDYIHIGALASNSDVAKSSLISEHLPALSEAILSGASEQIRNAASIGGNLLQATRCIYFRDTSWACNRRVEGAGCEALQVPTSGHAILGTSSACIATQPSDMAVALLAMDAIIVAQYRGLNIRIPIADFFRKPDQKAMPLNTLPVNALITSVEVPSRRMQAKSGYLKLRGRASYEFATASVAACLELDDNKVIRVAIAYGGVGTVPWRDVNAERLLLGHIPSRNQIDLYLDRVFEHAEIRPETAHKVSLARGAVHHMLERLAQ